VTLTIDQYVAQVVDRMPPTTPQRPQIEAELRSLITERLQAGATLDDVLRQLGEPASLADSYLAEVPLVAAGFWHRGAAKAIDLITLVVAAAVVAGLTALLFHLFVGLLGLMVGLTGLSFLFYMAICESRYGQTFGKRVMGLRVVTESGAQISFGQAVVRQLPLLFQVFWIDILFALFTDRKQRAAELLSKTRVIQLPRLGGSARHEPA